VREFVESQNGRNFFLAFWLLTSNRFDSRLWMIDRDAWQICIGNEFQVNRLSVVGTDFKLNLRIM